MSEVFDPYRKWLGIPAEEQPPNHYRLLGIALYESDPDVIHHAGDRLMTHLRTFQGGRHANHSQRLLNEVSAARVFLLNPQKKAEYDAQLRKELSPPVASAAAPPLPPPPAGKAVPVATAVMPAAPVVRTAPRGRATSYAKSRKKSSPLPMIFGILAVGAVGIVVMLFLLMRGDTGGNKPQAGGSNAPGSSSPSFPKPVPPDSLSRFEPPREAPPRLRESTPLVIPPSNPLGESPFAAPENPSSSQPPPLSVAEIEAQAVDDDLAEARELLGQREVEQANRVLSSLKGRAERYGKSEEYDHLGVIRYYLSQFWKEGVLSAARRYMQPGDTFEFDGDSVELVSVDELSGEITYKFNGTQATHDPRKLPTLPAIVFAWRGFRGNSKEEELADKFPYIYLATFLLFDVNSSLPADQRMELAQKYLAAGAEAGDTYVAQELERAATESPATELPAAEPPATDPPAAELDDMP